MQSHDQWLQDGTLDGPGVPDCEHVCQCCGVNFTHPELIEEDYDDYGHTTFVDADCADFPRCFRCDARGHQPCEREDEPCDAQ